ncbi:MULTISPECIES: hypothetical protein [unclassified Microcoleus]|uniref:hypothetical protein n=1 Tax=unclassified Microcoleus TaxID=2642155 RepID=UPI002FD014C2
MEYTNKSSRTVLRLLKTASVILEDEYSKARFEHTFHILKIAKTRGLLGTHKPIDDCLDNSINCANDLLRTPNLEEMEISDINKSEEAIYVYVALVAIGLIPA